MMERPGPSNMPPWEEVDRLAALQKYDILDTAPEVEFDSIAKIAAQICDTPLAFISFIDERRQWFKSRIGLDIAETPREFSVCDHAIRQPGVFVVPDLAADPRFGGMPTVNDHVTPSFYAGAPLRTKDGLPLGMLCVLDHKARPSGLSKKQEEALTALAETVMTQLELKLATRTAADGEEFTRRLLASSDDCITVFDLQGRLRFMSQAGLRAMEVADFGSMEGLAWTSMWSSAAANDASEALEKAKAGGTGRF
jgi:GAF domain-containing protein